MTLKVPRKISSSVVQVSQSRGASRPEGYTDTHTRCTETYGALKLMACRKAEPAPDSKANRRGLESTARWSQRPRHGSPSGEAGNFSTPSDIFVPSSQTDFHDSSFDSGELLTGLGQWAGTPDHTKLELDCARHIKGWSLCLCKACLACVR